MIRKFDIAKKSQSQCHNFRFGMQKKTKIANANPKKTKKKPLGLANPKNQNKNQITQNFKKHNKN
jgi:hypothetical protein